MIFHKIIYNTDIVHTQIFFKKPRISLEFHHVFTGLLAFSIFLFPQNFQQKDLILCILKFLKLVTLIFIN